MYVLLYFHVKTKITFDQWFEKNFWLVLLKFDK